MTLFKVSNLGSLYRLCTPASWFFLEESLSPFHAAMSIGSYCIEASPEHEAAFTMLDNMDSVNQVKSRG